MSNTYTPKEGDRVKVTFEADVTNYYHVSDSVELKDSDGEFYEFNLVDRVEGLKFKKIEKPMEKGWYLFSCNHMGDRVYHYDGTLWEGNVAINSNDVITRLDPVE